MHRVFVYGSLMRGFGNHVLLEDSTFVSPATVEGLSLYSLGPFPAVLHSPDNAGAVHGEVYEVSDETLAQLDRLEGHPTFYERQTKQAYVENLNGELECSLYIYQRATRPDSHIESGSWRSYHATEVRSA